MDPEAEAGNFADDDTKSESHSLGLEFIFQHEISLSWVNFRLGKPRSEPKFTFRAKNSSRKMKFHSGK